MARLLLNVSAIRRFSRVNGPGLRSVVWVQGCTIGCPGCFNSHTHPHTPMRLANPKELAMRLLRLPDTGGITISGGEPFEQANACAVLAEKIRRGGRTVMVFSGYRFELLRGSQLPSVQRFLACIDLLVAGPYIRSLSGNGSLWRGSINQTVHFLMSRMNPRSLQGPAREPVVEITIDGRSLASTGFPAEEDQAWMNDVVAAMCQSSNRSDMHRQTGETE